MKIIVLIAIIGLVYQTRKPLHCAIFYTVIMTAYSMMYDWDFTGLVIFGAITFAITFAFLWLLDRFSWGILHFVILLVGSGVMLLFT